MNEPPWSETEAELAARLHELVRTIEVHRLSRAGVRRRVEERARRRRLRRSLTSAALVAVALFVAIGISSAGDSPIQNRVVTGGPLVPAAPGSLPESGTAPATVHPPATDQPSTSSSTPATFPQASPGTIPHNDGPAPVDGRDGGKGDVPTTRGGADGPSPRAG